MRAAIGDAKTCPHGHPIVAGARLSGVPLADVAVGAQVRILRFENEAEEILHYLKRSGLEPGLRGVLASRDEDEVTVSDAEHGGRLGHHAERRRDGVGDRRPIAATAHGAARAPGDRPALRSLTAARRSGAAGRADDGSPARQAAPRPRAPARGGTCRGQRSRGRMSGLGRCRALRGHLVVGGRRPRRRRNRRPLRRRCRSASPRRRSPPEARRRAGGQRAPGTGWREPGAWSAPPSPSAHTRAPQRWRHVQGAPQVQAGSSDSRRWLTIAVARPASSGRLEISRERPRAAARWRPARDRALRVAAAPRRRRFRS